MRTIIYAVFNKETNERIYIDCRRNKCEEFIGMQNNKENLVVKYKWSSI